MSICIKEPCRVRLRCGGELDINRIDMTACYGACHDGPGDSRLCWLPCGHYSTPGADHPFDIVEVLAPLKPVVIDGPGQYHAIWGGEPCVVSVTGQEGGMWRVRGYPGCVVGTMVHADGSSFLGTAGSRVLAKVQTRQRPLTPDEAFKLLGKWATDCEGQHWSIHRIGERSVELTREEMQKYGKVRLAIYPTYEELARDYKADGDAAFSVTEPLPFAG